MINMQRLADERLVPLQNGDEMSETQLLGWVLETVRSALSHDVRSPLRAVNGYSRMLASEHGEVLGASGCTCLDRTIAATGRMDGMIDGLIGLLRTAQLPMHCELLPLSKMAAELAADNGYEDTLKVEPGLQAWGDRTMIRQALAALLGNGAARARESDDPHLLLRRYRHGPNAFAVEDNGSRIDAVTAESCFRPFTPGDPDPSRGMYLATVRLIANRHGGRSWIEDGTDQRTLFCCYLPRSV